MKKTLLLLAICSIFVACKQPQKGNIEVKNGEDKTVSVPYEIAQLRYDEFVSLVNKEQFISITEKASREAKMQCKFIPTYEPKSFSYFVTGDTINVMVNFQAKNTFGTPDLGMSTSRFLGGNLLPSEFAKTQLEEAETQLKLEEFANRTADSIQKALDEALK